MRESGLGCGWPIECAGRDTGCIVGDRTEADGRELSSLSLSLGSESSDSVPSPTWRRLGEVELSLGTREEVDTEGRRIDGKPRGRLVRKAALEGCREKIVGERAEVVDGVLSADWGLEITCAELETFRGDGELDGEADEVGCGESPEVGYGVWGFNMESDLGVSGDGRETVPDEVVMAAGAEREWGSAREESDKGDSGGVGGRDILGEAGAGLKRDLSRHHIWNTW